MGKPRGRPGPSGARGPCRVLVVVDNLGQDGHQIDALLRIEWRHQPLLHTLASALAHGRAAFRQALERAMQGQGAQCVQTMLLSNRGEAVAVKASIVALHGAYGAEGAVVLITALDGSTVVELPRAAE